MSSSDEGQDLAHPRGTNAMQMHSRHGVSSVSNGGPYASSRGLEMSSQTYVPHSIRASNHSLSGMGSNSLQGPVHSDSTADGANNPSATQDVSRIEQKDSDFTTSMTDKITPLVHGMSPEDIRKMVFEAVAHFLGQKKEDDTATSASRNATAANFQFRHGNGIIQEKKRGSNRGHH